MQPSTESLSTSDENNSQEIKDFKETVLDLLNKENILENDIIKASNELRLHPLLSIDIQEKLINEESFEMLKLSKINPIFTLNLLNVILIVNYVWNIVKKNIYLFHKILLELNIMFSYVLNDNNNEIAYVLLTTVPTRFYQLIAEKGKNCFKKGFSFDEDFLSCDKNNAQADLVYQENTIFQLNSMVGGKQIEAPNIMYFLNQEKCNELFKKSVFNRPENYPRLNYSLNFSFHGFKEIDYSFILNDDIKVKENLIFNKIYENNKVLYFFNSNDDNSVIELRKDTNIFIEAKTKFESTSVITNMIETSDLLSQAYNNLAFNDIEKKFSRQNNEYYLLYNNQRNDAISILGSLKYEDQQDKIEKTKVIYNSGYVQISSIVSLQNQIRSLNLKMDKMKEEMKEEMKKEMKEEMNNEIEAQIKARMKGLKKKMLIELKISEFISSNKIELSEIQNLMKQIKSHEDLLKFSTIHVKYSKLCENILNIDKDNNIINIANKVIGKLLNSEDEKKQFLDLLSLLDKKISENKFVAPYYKAFKSILTGPKWNSNYTFKNLGTLDIFSKTAFHGIILKILEFILVLEYDSELENYFFEAMLYFVYKISQTDIECYNLFYIYSNEKYLRETISKFIKSINKQNNVL